jgi:hypothetical protein
MKFGRTHGVHKSASVAAFLAAVALSGCGNSTDGGAFDQFVGIWAIDPIQSNFTLTCPAPNTASNGPLALWSNFVIEAGTTTDLVETSGLCRFGFNVAGPIATSANIDLATGTTPACRLIASDPPGSVFADVRPSWEFRLLKPEKGKAPTAQLVPASPVATLTFVTVDANGGEEPDPACTLDAQANLVKIVNF